MGVGAGLYMCDVVQKFTFAISSPDEFLYLHVVQLFYLVSLSNVYMFIVIDFTDM